MKKLTAVLVFVISCSAMAAAQVGPVRNPLPAPTPDPFPDATRANDISARSAELRMTELFPVATKEERKTLNTKIRPIYRESTKEEKAAIAPTEAVSNQYTKFLEEKNTGITRLVADIGCVTEDDVVSAKKECSTHTMPGGGSAYSFRVEDYRIQRLADINFRNNMFEALGTLTHGVLLYLGETPLESVTLESDGMSHLQKIKPTKNFADAGAFAEKLIKGYKDGEFIYASVMKAIPGRTYVLRTIAYRGEVQKSVGGLPYNELLFDERRDVIIAFHVAAMNPDQDITIVWKELKNKKAPKLTK